MIEEIKKELNIQIKSIEEHYLYDDKVLGDGIIEGLNRCFEILDKYKDKEDKYKNAWEELKLMVNAVAFDKVRTTMRDLETKNGIEVK